MARRTESVDGKRPYFSCRLSPKAFDRLTEKVEQEKAKRRGPAREKFNAGRLLDEIIMDPQFLPEGE